MLKVYIRKFQSRFISLLSEKCTQVGIKKAPMRVMFHPGLALQNNAKGIEISFRKCRKKLGDWFFYILLCANTTLIEIGPQHSPLYYPVLPLHHCPHFFKTCFCGPSLGHRVLLSVLIEQLKRKSVNALASRSHGIVD